MSTNNLRNNSSENGLNRIIDVNKILAILLSKWYFIIISVAICLLVSNLSLRYSKPIYLAELTMKLEDEKPNQINDIFRFSKALNKLDNFLKTESEILKSRTLALKTLKKLGYDMSYRLEGKIITTELYPNNLFNINIIHLDSTAIGRSFQIRFINDHKFDLINISNKSIISGNINDTFFFQKSLFVVQLKSTNLLKSYLGIPINCTINNLINNANRFSNSLSVNVEKGTSILNLAISSDVPCLASDYLNMLTRVYIDETINTKSQAAQQTINFIDEQLIDLSDKVKNSEEDLKEFKTRNNGIELEDIGKKEIEKLTKLETEKNILIVKTKMLEQMEQNVKAAKDKTLDLMNFDNEDLQTLPELFAILNQLIMEKLTLSSQYSAYSPRLMDVEKKMNEVKRSIAASIISLKEKTVSRITFNQKLIDDIKTSLSSLPDKQQILINIQREFKVNEKVYSYLLEKKIETSISRASLTSNAIIVDEALLPNRPISPQPSKTYMFSLALGISLGIGLIFIIRVFYQKIPDKETIESLSSTPVIGVIKKIEMEQGTAEYDVYVFKGPKSIFTESIRGIRTNINFILKGEKNKFICITSSVSGEGKTFCAINLAASLTMLNYKILIVGCDLRRPKLHLSFRDMTNDIGLSTYLIGRNTLNEVILTTEYENLFVLPAGPTPPNPAELLQTEKMNILMQNLKTQFDFVIFDTAPVGLVSDSFHLMKNADINLFILRAQYSKRDFALIPDRLKSDNEINNIYTILNSYDSSSITYSSVYKTEYGGYYGGGGYYYYGGYKSSGYGYYGRKYYSSYYSGYYSDEKTKRPWWKFWGQGKKKIV